MFATLSIQALTDSVQTLLRQGDDRAQPADGDGPQHRRQLHSLDPTPRAAYALVMAKDQREGAAVPRSGRPSHGSTSKPLGDIVRLARAHGARGHLLHPAQLRRRAGADPPIRPHAPPGTPGRPSDRPHHRCRRRAATGRYPCGTSAATRRYTTEAAADRRAISGTAALLVLGADPLPQAALGELHDPPPDRQAANRPDLGVTGHASDACRASRPGRRRQQLATGSPSHPAGRAPRLDPCRRGGRTGMVCHGPLDRSARALLPLTIVQPADRPRCLPPC